MKYYAINEESARQARAMWSFSEYKTGSKTAEYKQQVDDCYKIVDELPDDLKEKGAALADRYARRLADWYNKQFRIESMYPSVMICGPSGFNTRKKEKQNAAQDRHYKLYDEIQYIPVKIKKLLHGTDIIKSGDADAIEKLKKKIEKAEALQAEMKACNAYYRKHKSLKGYKDYTDEKAAELDAAISESMYKVPFAPYTLTNNNAKIRTAKKRLEQLESAKNAAQSDETANSDKYIGLPFKVVENAEIMRLQLYFDDKPDADTRAVLKKHGFRFAPTQNNAWQRHLNNNGRYALDRVIEELK